MKLRTCVLAAATCAVLVWSAAGQAVTATILGTITDATGAAIPGVEIRAKNTATGIMQSRGAAELAKGNYFAGCPVQSKRY